LAGAEFKWRGVVVNALVLTIGSWALLVLGLKPEHSAVAALFPVIVFATTLAAP